MEIISGSSGRGIERAAEVLRCGGLVAFPTETVYGLGADAANRGAVGRIFKAKGRPSDHPLIVHLADVNDVHDWAQEIPPATWSLAARFWPGPLTLILKCAPGTLREVTGGQKTIGVRIPGHPVARALLEAFGGGLAAPSANRFGRLSPTAAAHVVAELGDAADCVVDGGPCAVGIESTILDLSGEYPRILRPGAIGSEDLADALGKMPAGGNRCSPRVSGAMPAHYAPGTPLRLVETGLLDARVEDFEASGVAVAVLSMGPPPTALAGKRWWPMPSEPGAYARVLYERLRQADATGGRYIVVEEPPATKGWEAIHDRLRRASTGAENHEGESP